MNRIQAVVLVVVLALTAAFAAPPYLEWRRLQTATTDLEALSDGALRYYYHTNKPAPNPAALLNNPGVEGWRGPYLAWATPPKHPWGGDYVIDATRGLVGIAITDERAPEKFRLGGVAELSQPVRPDPEWFPPE